MTGRVPLRPWDWALALRVKAAAVARGMTTSDGLEMLLHQAVRGFELWFGLRPEVTREHYDIMAVDLVDV